MREKVLLLLDHAPNYRESFLRELSLYYTLIVVAHPCETDHLTPPIERGNYKYIELRKTFGNKIRINFELQNILKEEKPSIICVALNLRYPIRIFTFLYNKDLRTRWVWWGQILGSSPFSLLLKIKKKLIQKAPSTLTYTEDIVRELKMENVYSFNNSQFSSSDFKELENNVTKELKFLFVGRPQKRKNLEYLFKLANQYKAFSFRMVGPGMTSYFNMADRPSNLSLFEGAEGDELSKHFEWSNAIINPGHIGLLVMNAACHNRPVIVNSSVPHAPEVALAEEAGQFFVDFEEGALDVLFNRILMNPDLLIEKGKMLYDIAFDKYTVEKMALNHKKVFDEQMEKL